MERNFARSFDSLTGILEFTNEVFADEPEDDGLRYTVDLAIDELFTNMVKYNANSPADIGLAFSRIDGGIAVTLTDFETKPFDITQASPVDINLSVEERKIGGLGIHLVRQMVDSLEFSHVDGTSTIRFTKLRG